MKVSHAFRFLMLGLASSDVMGVLDNCQNFFKDQRLISVDEYATYIRAQAVKDLVRNSVDHNVNLLNFKSYMLKDDGSLRNSYAERLPDIKVVGKKPLEAFAKHLCQYNSGNYQVAQYCAKVASGEKVKPEHELPLDADLNMMSIDSRATKAAIITDLCAAAVYEFPKVCHKSAEFYVNAGLMAAATSAPTPAPTPRVASIEGCPAEFRSQRVIDIKEYIDFQVTKAAMEVVTWAESERGLDVTDLRTALITDDGSLKLYYERALPPHKVIPKEVFDDYFAVMCKHRVSGDGTWDFCNSETPRTIHNLPADTGKIALGRIDSQETKGNIVRRLCANANAYFPQTVDEATAYYLGKGLVVAPTPAPTMAPFPTAPTPEKEKESSSKDSKLRL